MRCTALIVSAFLLLAAGHPALAEKRVALVIGNSAYENVPRLGNPANDAAAMTKTLKEAGFDVVNSRRDLKVADMRRAFRDFSDQARDADVAVVYYAGHGLELDGTDYLVPVDAVLERDIDVFDEALPLDRILATIEPARQLRLVILDACRDNPFAQSMKRTIGSRSISRGLAKIEPNSPNTLIAFAAKAGSTAADGDSKNSPFTSALVRHITTPGLDLRKAFGFVRDEVLKNTNNRQEPFVYGSLGGEDVTLVPAKPVEARPAPNPQADIRFDYELAEQVGTPSSWTSFLNTHPSGFYADLAREQLEKIVVEEARVAATEKARLAQEEKARLAAEGAKKAEQAKAAADAKAAEQARVAAEKAKQVEQVKLAAAEQTRAAAEKSIAEKAAAEKADAEKIASDKAAADKAASDKAATATAAQPVSRDQQIASLPPQAPAAPAGLSQGEISQLVQLELKRVGCFAGSIDGQWNAASQRSLELFNKHAGTKLDVKLASLDVLDAVKAKPARICPLICDHGFEAEGESCVKITCGRGLFLNEDNECEKVRQKPRAGREESSAPREKPQREQIQAERPKPQASGQIVCNQQGCQPVRPGCRMIRAREGSSYSGGQAQVCN